MLLTFQFCTAVTEKTRQSALTLFILFGSSFANLYQSAFMLLIHYCSAVTKRTRPSALTLLIFPSVLCKLTLVSLHTARFITQLA